MALESKPHDKGIVLNLLPYILNFKLVNYFLCLGEACCYIVLGGYTQY